MNSSLRLLLEDFLGLMKEEGELDVFLPLLMSAMGHEVVYRPQKGPRQYGVDVLSVGPDEAGTKTLFLWLVKCGDIGRADWDSGPQSIYQSTNDVAVYLRSHIAPQHQALKKKLLIVTNGDFRANLVETIAAFLEDWSRLRGVPAEMVNGSTLAAWTEQHLLNEYVLPSANRALLRRMLANVSIPELSAKLGRSLIDELLKGIAQPAKSQRAEAKQFLTGMRGIRTALTVLHIIAGSEGNFLSSYLVSQYTVLAAWAGLHGKLINGERAAVVEFHEVLAHLAIVAEAYHQRMEGFYLVQDGFAHKLPDHVLVSQHVFDELGRLGVQGCLMANMAGSATADTGKPEMEALAHGYANRIAALLSSHSCSALPVYDHHSAHIHAALLSLVVCRQHEEAKAWLESLCARLHHATGIRKFLPMSGSFEEALSIRHGYAEMADENCAVSTLFPILLVWTAVLGMDDFYKILREQVHPRLQKSTPNFWSSEEGFDAVVASPIDLHEHGIGEPISHFPEDPQQFLHMMSQTLRDVEPIESCAWYRARAPYVPLLAAIHWGTQVPRVALVKQAIAFASSVEAMADAPVAQTL